MTCLLIGLLAGAITLPAAAGDRHARRSDTRQHEQAQLDEAVGHARRDTGGRVLSARKREGGRGERYRIKVLMPDATVRSLDVDLSKRDRR